MRIVINLKIPQSIVREMDVYRKKYHPSGLSHSHAHITLVPPFVLKGKFTDLTKDIRDCMQAVKPFAMQINGISSFGDKVLFFKPTCPRPLKKFHTELKQCIQKNHQRSANDAYWQLPGYHPHATIAKDSPQSIKHYQKELSSLLFKKRFAVEGIDLYVWEKNCWVLKKKFVFENGLMKAAP